VCAHCWFSLKSESLIRYANKKYIVLSCLLFLIQSDKWDTNYVCFVCGHLLTRSRINPWTSFWIVDAFTMWFTMINVLSVEVLRLFYGIVMDWHLSTNVHSIPVSDADLSSTILDNNRIMFMTMCVLCMNYEWFLSTVYRFYAFM
jgi:hypothetical protein